MGYANIVRMWINDWFHILKIENNAWFSKQERCRGWVRQVDCEAVGYLDLIARY